ncbi:unnamed protein product, partial [Scytosiphon promiscuus]
PRQEFNSQQTKTPPQQDTEPIGSHCRRGGVYVDYTQRSASHVLLLLVCLCACGLRLLCQLLQCRETLPGVLRVDDGNCLARGHKSVTCFEKHCRFLSVILCMPAARSC